MRSRSFILKLLCEVEGSQLLRVISYVCEHALSFLDSPGSITGRAEIRPDRGDAVEDIFPATLDCGDAHEEGIRCRGIVGAFESRFKQLLFSGGECEAGFKMMLKQNCRDRMRICAHRFKCHHK